MTGKQKETMKGEKKGGKNMDKKAERIKALEAYDKAIAPAWKAYKKVEEPASEAYKKAIAPAWEAYEKRLKEIEKA